ncbi:PseG/SpsG family protein [Aliikangiella coralliicola]|uniref:Acetylneuraminate cytidylyltransferase n=1 Tax=Aliikangiella coralliicola TaxID=2592383 RepID=A0A545UD09_9GAMM|nr:glycosyltransferase [Aliikangiella coralliicola]TQV87323.1 acetylneuraminate cytidylyltransferase [Aliikangiella coralliicola]
MLCVDDLSPKKICFVVEGGFGVGLGHCYRALSIAETFADDVEKNFILTPGSFAGRTFMESKNINRFQICDSYSEIVERLIEYQPDVVVNDILNSREDYMVALRKSGLSSVNIDDIGPGSFMANLVINSVYDGNNTARCLYGSRYVDVKSKYFLANKKKLSPKVKTILITFGGEDPANLTRRVIDIVGSHSALRRYCYQVVLGCGYRWKKQIVKQLAELRLTANILVDVDLAKIMGEVDMAIAANGRTTFELAAMGVPTVVISAHARECLNTFYREAGFFYCGNCELITDQQILNKLLVLSSNFQKRLEMRNKMQGLELQHGLTRINRAIRSQMKVATSLQRKNETMPRVNCEELEHLV